MPCPDYRAGLALGIGWGLASLLETWLLAFLFAVVAGEEAAPAEGLAKVFVHDQQGAGHTLAGGFGLAGGTTPGNVDGHVELAVLANGAQGRGDGFIIANAGKVDFAVFFVDGYFAGTTGEEAHARSGSFTAAGAFKISFSHM